MVNKKIKWLSLLIIVLNLSSGCYAKINNTIAYGVSNSGGVTPNDVDTATFIAQCWKQDSTRTIDGILIYLDRLGMADLLTDSMRVRVGPCSTTINPRPALSRTVKTIYMKIGYIPDGDADRYTRQPDSTTMGYAIWFIFDVPYSLTADSHYFFVMNAPKNGSDNRINWFYGNNGLAGDSAWYWSGGIWNAYSTDMNFKVIKDRYSLVDIRRFPFNLKGAISINSDIDSSSIPYIDTLHKWLNGNLTWGGVAGLNGKYADNLVWLAKGPSADSLGKGSGEMPFYFHGLDTTSLYKSDSIANYISRGWADGLHTFGDCGYGTPDPDCMDSTHANKFLNYMINHPSVFGKLYKAGLWVGHGPQLINIGFEPGDVTGLGDTVSVYHHTHHTLASGRFKFFWNGKSIESTQKQLGYFTWQNITAINDSLNIGFLPFDNYTLRDGVKSYMFYRNGSSAEAANPGNLHLWFNQAWAHSLRDSNYITIIITHLACVGGLPVTDRDSIKMFHDSSSVWGLWLPSTKRLLNQQSASAFSQITVDRPASSRRRVNIDHLTDWSWGTHYADLEELYYLTFIAYAPESLLVTYQTGTSTYDTLADSVMINQQETTTDYTQNQQRLPMSYVGNGIFGRLIVIEGEAEQPPMTGKRRLFLGK